MTSWRQEPKNDELWLLLLSVDDLLYEELRDRERIWLKMDQHLGRGPSVANYLRLGHFLSTTDDRWLGPWQPGEKAPSKQNPLSPKKHLAGLVLSKTVEVKSYGRDRYGRILGVVFLDGRNINLEMVRAGMAEVYRGKPQPGFDLEPYQQAEEEAREAGRGMWSQGEKYVSPREWRRIHR